MSALAQQEEDEVFSTAPNINNLIELTAKLAQVLAKETELMEQMRIRDLEPLQKEKTQLLEVLERQKKILLNHPYILEEITDEEAEDLAEIVNIFQIVAEENYNRLLLAREVNMKVVEAISEVVSEAKSNGIYNETGKTDLSNAAVSITVNKTI